MPLAAAPIDTDLTPLEQTWASAICADARVLALALADCGKGCPNSSGEKRDCRGVLKATGSSAKCVVCGRGWNALQLLTANNHDDAREAFETLSAIARELDIPEPYTLPCGLGEIVLPYRTDRLATCPRFDKFLAEVQPDDSVRDFLQEWFGYCLTRDTSHEVFVALTGIGGNGKSVLLLAQRLMLGAHNVSSIALDQFDGKHTSALAELKDKRVNISEELRYGRCCEGLLKDLVSGGTVRVQPKAGKPAFDLVSPAKLIFAANTLPPVADRTESVWRRMVVVPFNVTFDRRSANVDLKRAEYWTPELPGIFNWSLQGLGRLWDRGRFIEPESCLAVKADYRESQADPHATFLREHYQAASGGEIACNDLYSAYFNAIAAPLSAERFARVVRECFPSAEKTSPRRMPDGKQLRFWRGIGRKDATGSNTSGIDNL